MVIAPHLYPFQSRYLALEGGRLHYLDEGRGQPLVLVHGNPSWSFYYRSLIQALRDRFRLIAPDHMGCGLSDKPDDRHYDYSLARRVEDLATLLDHLDLKDKITLVVHDWGGMIGLAYAVRFPERIARLVISNTAAFPMPAEKRFPLALSLCRNTPLGPFLVRGLNGFCRAAVRVCVKRKPMAPEIRKAYLAPYDSWKNRVAVLRFVQDIPLKPSDRSYRLVAETRDRLHLLEKVPVLICWGDRDFVFSGEFLDQWLKHFPDAEVHRIPDAGHYLLEDASQQVIPLIENFLEANSAQGIRKETTCPSP